MVLNSDCRANRWTGFYMITAPVMKGLNKVVCGVLRDPRPLASLQNAPVDECFSLAKMRFFTVLQLC